MAIKYKWLAGKLKEMTEKNIKSGIEKLPTEQELCSRYRVSRQTVRQALALLEKENLIVRRQGSGSYITGVSPDQRKNTVAVLISDDQEYIYPGVLRDICTELSENGFTPQSKRIIKQKLEAKGIFREKGTVDSITRSNVVVGYELKEDV